MRNGTSSYSFDQIGNRTTVSIPDEPNPVVYVPNALNQYTSITGGTASSPSYDDDGNMTDNGAGNTHTWTGENRLEAFTEGDITVENTYDGQGRRVRKLVKDLGAVTQDLRYMYDGWNLLYEVDMHQVSEPTRRYVWGHDLSGHAGLPRLGVGAGGVGGLLFTESDGVSHTVTYDANGNISEYVDLADGSITAHLEYDAFGRTIASTGTTPAPFGFSTKYQDEESGYHYYGFRFYDAETGRWLNRDPIEEQGGYNLYGFVGNDGLNSWDYLGNEDLTLKLVIGFEKSTIANEEVMAAIRKQLDFLNEVIKICIKKCGDGDDKIKVKVDYDWNRKNKKTPDGPIYNMRDNFEVHKAIIVHNKTEISKVKPDSIPIIWSAKPYFARDGRLAGGTAFDRQYIQLFQHGTVVALAHELGHIIEYEGDIPDDPDHSSEEGNLMGPGPDHGRDPDCQYYKKLIEYLK